MLLRELTEQYPVFIAQTSSQGQYRLVGIGPRLLFDSNLGLGGFQGDVEMLVFIREPETVNIFAFGPSWSDRERVPVEKLDSSIIS